MNAQLPVPGYIAVRHILTSPPLAARTAPYINADGFDWAGLLAEAVTMSEGERLLLRIAHDLWEGTSMATVAELPRKLSTSNFERVLLALRWCHGDPVGSNGWESAYRAVEGARSPGSAE